MVRARNAPAPQRCHLGRTAVASSPSRRLSAAVCRLLVGASLVAAAEATHPDALIVLGPAVGYPSPPGVVDAACEVASLPLFCGGGLDGHNLLDYLGAADGFFVGSGLKEDRRWQAPVSEAEVRRLIGAVEYARGQEVRQ